MQRDIPFFLILISAWNNALLVTFAVAHFGGGERHAYTLLGTETTLITTSTCTAMVTKRLPKIGRYCGESGTAVVEIWVQRQATLLQVICGRACGAPCSLTPCGTWFLYHTVNGI
jgi:hypothetical protein